MQKIMVPDWISDGLFHRLRKYCVIFWEIWEILKESPITVTVSSVEYLHILKFFFNKLIPYVWEV